MRPPNSDNNFVWGLLFTLERASHSLPARVLVVLITSVYLKPPLWCSGYCSELSDRKVQGSSPDINIIGCHQEGHPDIK